MARDIETLVDYYWRECCEGSQPGYDELSFLERVLEDEQFANVSDDDLLSAFSMVSSEYYSADFTRAESYEVVAGQVRFVLDYLARRQTWR